MKREIFIYAIVYFALMLIYGGLFLFQSFCFGVVYEELFVKQILGIAYNLLFMSCFFYIPAILIYYRVVKNKCNVYLKHNEFDIAERYINNEISSSLFPNKLKIIKILVVAMRGNINEYYKETNELFGTKVSYNVYYNNCVRCYDCIFDYFRMKKIEETLINLAQSPSSIMEVTAMLIHRYKSGCDLNELIRDLNRLSALEPLLYKSVANLLLSEIYNGLGENDKKGIYLNKALEYSPSEEITQCIQKHMDVMNNQIV